MKRTTTAASVTAIESPRAAEVIFLPTIVPPTSACVAGVECFFFLFFFLVWLLVFAQSLGRSRHCFSAPPRRIGG